jgi:hypothetical protein
MDRAKSLYRTDPRCLLTLFDIRCADSEQRLRRELAGWRGFAHAEKLLEGYVVLVMQPGGASGGAR